MMIQFSDHREATPQEKADAIRLRRPFTVEVFGICSWRKTAEFPTAREAADRRRYLEATGLTVRVTR